jgi:hypothetical protein
MNDKKPFEIARETLKQLTVRKLPPIPINYQNLYNEIAGIPQTAPQTPCAILPRPYRPKHRARKNKKDCSNTPLTA